MKIVYNFPLWEKCFDEYGDVSELEAEVASLGCDGVETICDVGYEGPYPRKGLAIGHHLIFWAFWVDFWTGNREAMLRELGTQDVAEQYYGGPTRDALVQALRYDLERAELLGSQYVVFHVSEVGLAESFSYVWNHGDELVIDCAAELANEAMAGHDWPFVFCVENQWWPGFRFTDPHLTDRLLNKLNFSNKGIMLDIGHLMHTNNDIVTQADAAKYVDDMVSLHGSLAQEIKGLHLHQSISSEYVKAHTGPSAVPDNVQTGTYWERYGNCYEHILAIDGHQPWTDTAIVPVIERIDPQFINNELSAAFRQPHAEAVRTQMQTLAQGGLHR